jgi:hypothetical protein
LEELGVDCNQQRQKVETKDRENKLVSDELAKAQSLLRTIMAELKEVVLNVLLLCYIINLQRLYLITYL